MTLAPGTRIGAYEIVAALGAGGMGEVYRAKDTRLGRSAALKTLPLEFALDEERRARFEREAKTLAALNHPHIAQIYGLEELPSSTGGPPTLALVMELVEGEDLAQRLTRGPVPLDEVWPLARQIAEGLEAAHEAGIVHRDLKPANIRVTADGLVKVLDFGLAKPMESGATGVMATHSPTLTSPALTTRGVILGTASYMAPEQAKGKPVDRRADIWAFGCVVYELLTGRCAFDGEDVPEILGSIIKSEPDWSRLPPTASARAGAILRRCLAKDRSQRWQHIGDVRLALAEALAEPPPSTTVGARSSSAGWIVAGIAAAIAAAVGIAMSRPRSEPPMLVTRFSILLQDDQEFTNSGRHVLALAPDGSTLVFVANSRLYRRRLATDEFDVVAGTETQAGTMEPVFSPDGQWIAFYSFDERAIKRVRLDGGGAKVVCQASPVFGMSWGSSGILFAEPGRGISRVSPEGGRPELIVPVEPPQVAAAAHELPGSDWIAFSVAQGNGLDRWERGSIMAQRPGAADRRVLVASATDSRMAEGYLLYRTRRTLFAVALSSDGLSTVGTPTKVLDGLRTNVAPDLNPPTGQFTAAGASVLAYLKGDVAPVSRVLGIVDRQGAARRLAVPEGSYEAPRVSPDGRYVAYAGGPYENSAIWIAELSGASPPRRLTFDAPSWHPVWSADGAWLYFQSLRDSSRRIWRQRADGSGPLQMVTGVDGAALLPEAATPDGSTLLFSKGEQGSGWTLGSWSTSNSAVRFFDGIASSAALNAALSPDGRWLAYTVIRAGMQATSYVEPFPPTGAKYELPHRLEAVHPVWAREGLSLMFRDYSTLFQIDIETLPLFRFGLPRIVERGSAVLAGSQRRNLDFVGTAGSFVAILPADERAVGPNNAEHRIHVVLNWQEPLRGRPATATP